MSEQLKARITANGPKKILALDGGGIRGMITVEVLAEIESLLRRKLGRGDDFRLADYFDFVAGTSTGAIIAACISVGMTVSEIRAFYISSGKEMFEKASLLKRFRHKYGDEKLGEKLQTVFGKDTRLGSDNLKTVLMMVMRNATTDSPWPISNNPFAKYNQRLRDDGCPRDNCNLDVPLWQLIRASTAAPVYFPPEVVKVGGNEFVFVDGGITMYNNPDFQAFLMATVAPYKMSWPVGEDQLLVLSIGTGTSPQANADLEPGEMNVMYNATSIPSALMSAALNEQDLLCRVFGRCLAGEELDREVGDLKDAKGPVGPNKLFTYARYNAELTLAGLKKLGLSGIKPEQVLQLGSLRSARTLCVTSHPTNSTFRVTPAIPILPGTRPSGERSNRATLPGSNGTITSATPRTTKTVWKLSSCACVMTWPSCGKGRAQRAPTHQGGHRHPAGPCGLRRGCLVGAPTNLARCDAGRRGEYREDRAHLLQTTE